VRARGGSENEFIAIIEDDKCVGRMSCGNEYDTHLWSGIKYRTCEITFCWN
jgi:hypothetical protein